MFTPKPHRLPTFDYAGFQRYFLTFCTHQRRRVFVSERAVSLVRAQILRCAQRERFALVAYCFMPDHLHLLVEGLGAASDGRRFIRLLKQTSGYYWQREHGYPLWQRYGYERVLRSDEDTAGVVRYILENPIRAGLVDRCQDHPHSGSEIYSIEALADSVAWKPQRSG